MGRQLIYVLIPSNIEDIKQYVINILDKYIQMNKQILITTVTLKQIFDDVKTGKIDTFKDLCEKHYIEYDTFSENINKDFPILWKYYDDFSINEQIFVSDILIKSKFPCFIDINGKYSESLELLSQSENVKCVRIWMKI